MARMLLVGLRRQQLGKTKQVHKNLPNLNWSVVQAPHTHDQISMGMGNISMNKLKNVAQVASALGVLGALAFASGADWFFGGFVAFIFRGL
jgi:hypothetical protein